MLVEVKTIKKEEITVVSSLDVAETFGKEHKEVIRAIEGQKNKKGKTKHAGLIEQLKQRGDIPLEKYFIKSHYIGENGKQYKQYFMTRDGFTLLVMGFTGDKALNFKIAYIGQFNAMEKIIAEKTEERHKAELERVKGIAVRQALTTMLQQSGENERMHGHAYSTYTNLIYKTLFDMPANKLRQELGIGLKDNIRDYLTQEQLQAIQHLESLINGLIAVGWGYDQIKEFVQTNNIKRIS